MTLSYSYQRELESLILDTLLPVYVKTLKAQGVKEPLYGINPELLKQVKKAKVLPALLRPKEKWACEDLSNSV